MQLDFEKQVILLEQRIQDLRHASADPNVDIMEELSTLQAKVDTLLESIYSKLTPWQKVEVARHPERPHFVDYIRLCVKDFVELCGDRLYGDDKAVLGGIGRIDGIPLMLIGHEKGHDTDTRMRHNFGMGHPEGYRKAQRLMRLAEQYALPVVTLVDTAGAFPGPQAEERGQSEAIAKSIDVCLSLSVPVVSIVIGEGGSGGAVALATANKVAMLEHAVYSVISPEGCASILWRDADKKSVAASSQKLTAEDLIKLNVIDAIIKEPLGGAHRDHKHTVKAVSKFIVESLKELREKTRDELIIQREKKFLSMGE